MPNAGVMSPRKQVDSAPNNAAPILLTPFTRASTEHEEQFYDSSTVMTTATQALPPQDVPAYGYLRFIRLLINATGGVGATTTATSADAPFNALQEIQIADVNGAPLVGPLGGYDLYLINKYGGYEFATDPRNDFSFSDVVAGASASGNFAFSLKIPIEICERDGLGALANQNASSTYKLKITLNASTTVYATPPSTTLPTVRVRASLLAWAQPPVSDLRGQPQATTPPAHGTSQYWTKTTLAAALGSNTLRLPRVGNYIRNLIFVNRLASSGARIEANFPDPVNTYWDTRLLHSYVKSVYRDVIKRRTGYVAALDAVNGQDSGVFVYDWCHEFDAKIGRELRDGWLQTVQSTRLEINGTWTSAACSVDVLTNDVAPAGEVFI